MKEHALHYASLGIPVFPCKQDKSPWIRGGFHSATRDPVIINEWWNSWPDALIGYPTGTASGIDVLDLDFDPSKGKDGLSKIPDWRSRSSVIVRTPRGGAHLLYKSTGTIRNTSDQIAHGVDTRGTGGYAILPPSMNGAGPYKFETGDEYDFVKIGPFPSDLLALLKNDERERVSGDSELADEHLVALALAAIPNQDLGWDDWNRIGLATWAATAGSDAGFEAFAEWSAKSVKYNAKLTSDRWHRISGSPPDRIGAGTLFYEASQEKPNWDAAYHKAQAAFELNPGTLDFLHTEIWKVDVGGNIVNDNLVDLPHAAKVEAVASSSLGGGDDGSNIPTLSEMNAKYAVVLDGGKVSVLMFEKSVEQAGHHRHERSVPMFLSFEDFKNLHMNKKVSFQVTKTNRKQESFTEDVFVPVGQWWLAHEKRKEYLGLIFDPSKGEVVNGRLNLWRGWGVKPVLGDWSLMKEHIRIVLAAGRADNFDYIIRWLAWAVQNPAKRAEVAMVFKGGRGAGKGTLGNAMCRIFGQHGIHISNAKHLTGFNAHLRDACFLFADEAYWPGDKSAEGDLKRLITEPELFIRAMRRDGVMVDNMLHVMMASNEDWIVPAGEKERRYAAFLCDDKHLQSESWFAPLYEQLNAGGYAAMLADLLAMDLGSWHPRRIPSGLGGSELLNQQSKSLEPADAWWVELLETGTLAGCDPKNPCSAVSNEYIEEKYGYRMKGLYDQARLMEPRLKGRNDHTLGHFLKGKGCLNDKKVMRRRGWTFPDLGKLRKEWESRFPGWQWRDTSLKEWQGTDQGEAVEPPL